MRIAPLALASFALAAMACVDTTVPTIPPGSDDATAAAADATSADPDGGVPADDATTSADPDAGVGFADAQPAPDAAAPDAAAPDAAAPDAEPLANFSFFVTSIEAMRQLSGSPDGFGGNLSYNGQMGILGADEICEAAAELGMPGASAKTWRAFLSASTGGPNGGPIHAIERVGSGPWYDRNGRLVAQTVANLATTRPTGANAQIVNDLPNERGESQRNQPGANGQGLADNHDILTGSSSSGRFPGGAATTTCNDWTSNGDLGARPMLGHSWPAMSGQSWMRAHNAAGCQAVVNLVQNGPGSRDCEGVGCGGGYGGIYCFALEP